jgi:hypothetical protein
MTRHWFARYLLSPSILSGTLCSVLAALTTAGIAWSYIANNQLFYDFLFGTKGAATALVTAPDSFEALQATLFSSQFTFYILLLGVALVTGFAVYALLQGASGAFSRTKTIVRGLRTKDTTAKKMLEEIIMRLATRSFSLVGGAVFIGFFVNVLLPFCVLLVNGGTADIADSHESGWWLVIGGFGFLLLGLHMLVIFTRLVFLKPRLFSSNDIALHE